MRDINDGPVKGNVWKAIAIFCVCLDFILIIYGVIYFVRIYKLLSVLNGEISSNSLTPIDDVQLRKSIINSSVIKISISLIITATTIFYIIKRKYKIAAIINGIPLLLLGIFIAIMMYVFSGG
jgi:hypothetical protein